MSTESREGVKTLSSDDDSTDNEHDSLVERLTHWLAARARPEDQPTYRTTAKQVARAFDTDAHHAGRLLQAVAERDTAPVVVEYRGMSRSSWDVYRREGGVA